MLLCSIKIAWLVVVGMGLGMESGLDLARFFPELYLTRKLQRVPWIAAAIRCCNMGALGGALNLGEYSVLLMKRPLRSSSGNNMEVSYCFLFAPLLLAPYLCTCVKCI